MFKKLQLKKWTSWLISLAMVLSFITPFNVSAASKTIDIQILATSDTHGKFLPYEYAVNSENKSGSMAQLATAIKELKKANPNTIIVDAGDTIQDNSASLFLNNAIHPMILAMNEIGYDIWTLGNHEFNYGIPTLDKVASKFKGTVLCGNVYKKDGKRLGVPYKILEKAGVKVGIIGMTTPNITRWDSENLKDCKVTDPIEETKKAISEIKNKVNVIIAVVHMSEGEEYGNKNSSAVQLANTCPELAAIVAAHEHKAVDGARYNNTLLVENKNLAQTLAKIDIKLTEKGGKYVVNDKAKDVTSKIIWMQDSKTKAVNYESDKALEAKLNPYHKIALDDANKIIGELKGGNLVPEDEVKGIPTSQIQETAMINLINEVQMYYTKADVAAAAAFRSDANMKEGKIKKSDTSLIYKYDNTLYLLEVTGKQLKDYMEWSASYYNAYKPGDLTLSFNENIRGYNYDMFSGVKYDIDVSKEPGNRIVNLRKMDDTSIKDTDTLKLAVNNYRASSHLLNSKNEIFKDGSLPKVIEKDIAGATPIRDLIGKYIVEVKNGVITPQMNNNWNIVGNNWDSTKRVETVKLINEGRIKIPQSKDGRTPNVAAVTETNLEDAKNTKMVNIISFNDYHGVVKESGKDLGIAKFAAAINNLKKENKNTIVVSGGDLYQGTALSNLNYGAPVNEMIKYIGVTASAVGNHEFDWGTERIANWAKEGGFDFLASNIYDKKTGKPVDWAKPYKIVEIDGIKIGFIGLATPETLFKTKPTNVQNTEFKDASVAAKEWNKKLRSGELKEGKADVVIALTHLGSFQDNKTKVITGEAADLAKANVGVDAIISAHTHLPVSGEVNKIPIVQGNKNGRAYVKLEVAFNTKTNKVTIEPAFIDLSAKVKTLPEDETGKAIIKKYEDASKSKLDEVVGKTDKDLPHDRFEGPSLLGEWVCDVMAKTTKSQIALTNGGGLRCPIEKGNITVGKLYELMPFDNTLFTMELKGSDIKRVVENGIGNKKIGWIAISGLKVKYDLKQPFGNRIYEMTLKDGSRVDMNKYYTVVTNDFMAVGGDDYDFKGAKNLKDTNLPIRDALINELKQVKNLSVVKAGYLTVGTKSAVKPEVKPQPKPELKPSDKKVVYTVKEGDCLYLIGKKYNISYEKIAEENKIDNVNLIFIGQKLVIPGN
ncbi:2',3'-cyclic-nucleotide 2'-phosphodiesterase (5'-nucleotidase family) [Clostridium tetanomorphum]|uniref:LysM peptidoglycan-binding domain-containing protein n=1 Tax=Clostridium tetanomorphum TaxID=1553 RepID=A0A923J0T0_CLOTT|nr:5'-nucleotidase C-terminal domain-containing protein [Clostridium tetanomorphum]KAJ51131.1 LPXTG-motif cell wall anchor domain-containing protein [Clostridium tetanomorphum DSM 665]MBC2398049.1 LysM peptidoglycan-binding domain-containing protein [Clostridium tetanomorphum]MBP1864441.1 2',3'-cyclic-nucleotide 2'-phosphodiesterase (5'-nucleotidase family) [Clostridium tetanomorphum]NRS83028.1 2',3'-cyclic-nucleotide 2'-phosphodiesterase (5'-nucleotidase family) [Clostridium tetanomorphum]NRZ